MFGSGVSQGLKSPFLHHFLEVAHLFPINPDGQSNIRYFLQSGVDIIHLSELLLEGGGLIEVVVHKSAHNPCPQQELPRFSAQSREPGNHLEVLHIVRHKPFEFVEVPDEDQDHVAQNCKALRIPWICPVKVQSVLLVGVDLKHGAVDQTCDELSHLFLGVLKQILVNQLLVAELFQQPLGTVKILVDISLD